MSVIRRVAEVYYYAESKVAFALPIPLLGSDGLWEVLDRELGTLMFGLYYPNRRAVDAISREVSELYRRRGIPRIVPSWIDPMLEIVKIGKISLDPARLLESLVLREGECRCENEDDSTVLRLVQACYFYAFHDYVPPDLSYVDELECKRDGSLLRLSFTLRFIPCVKFELAASIFSRSVLSFSLRLRFPHRMVEIYPIYFPARF